MSESNPWIVLLDHNFTLVENSHERRSPFIEQIAIEQYRAWLVELVRPERVILVTARPQRYEVATIRSIAAKCGGWTPAEWHFNATGERPPAWKERVLMERLLPRFSEDRSRLVAIESNPKTARMYGSHGIASFRAEEVRAWKRLRASDISRRASAGDSTRP